MKIQYCSDLHLEFPENNRFLKKEPLIPVGEILILAGDIIPFAVQDMYSHFLDYVSKNFHTVYWIPGNHEYYRYDITQKENVIYEQIRHNVFLVNNRTVVHDNVRLVFSTLWSYIKAVNEWDVQQNISDFSLIKNNKTRFTPQDFNQLHRTALEFLTGELKYQDTQTVVVTHHVPTFMNYPEQYKGSPLNDVFAVELFSLIESCSALYWIYGHSHCNTQPFLIGNTTLLTNQLGYVHMNEHTNFIRNAFIEI
jgi:predicted phosphohydrolase